MSRYDGRIKVVCTDWMCFPVSPKTLEALATSCYDPWAFNPDQTPIETISYSEWLRRKNALTDQTQKSR